MTEPQSSASGPTGAFGALGRPDQDASTQELVQAVLTGDQPAMVGLVSRYRARVFGLCLKMLGQREDAEDAAQETFVRMFAHLDRWDRTRLFEPWLLTIAANRCRTRLARRRTRPEPLPLDDRTATTACAIGRSIPLREELDRALAHLRTDHREAFLLFHRDQLPYQDIADRLGVPLGTVKTWVHRARQDLMRTLTARDVMEATS